MVFTFYSGFPSTESAATTDEVERSPCPLFSGTFDLAPGLRTCLVTHEAEPCDTVCEGISAGKSNVRMRRTN